MFVFTIIIGVVALFSFNDWLNQLSSGILDSRIKIVVFLISSLIGPSILFFLFQALDESWWRYRWTKFLIDIPDLNGWYYGCIESIIRAQDNKDVRKDCALEIVQTGSRIIINMWLFEEAEQHYSSNEDITSFLLINNEQTRIYYIFRNQKDPRKAGATPPISIGTAELKIAKSSTGLYEIRGSYYNQRGNTGMISATFVDRTLAGQFRRPVATKHA